MTTATASVRRPHSRLAGPIAVVVTLALVMLGAYLMHKPGQSAASVPQAAVEQDVALKVGKTAPDFTATTLSGAQVKLSQFRGHPVWLNFNATWCADCRTEAPDLQDAYLAAKPSGLVVLSVYLNDTAALVKDYSSRVPASYIQIPDPKGTISDGYQVAGVPTQVFIAADGTVQAVVSGTLTRPQMDAHVKALQAAGKS